MNRGVDRMQTFRTRLEGRYFESLIARACRRGEIELHAHCVMGNHFHLLVRSPAGRLAHGMHRIQHTYARWFNALNDRDGPLFRGRYVARSVDDDAYRCTVIRYIDANPVVAGLCDAIGEWEPSSARRIATDAQTPWLCTSFVDALLPAARVRHVGRWAAYQEEFGHVHDAQFELVERRLAAPQHRHDPLAFFVSGHLHDLVPWLMGLRLRDVRHYAPTASITSVESAICAIEASRGHAAYADRVGGRDPDQVMRVGLRLVLCRTSLDETAHALRLSNSSVRRAASNFFDGLERDEVFAELVASTIVESVRNSTSPVA